MESSTTKKILKPWPLGWKAKIGVLIPSVDTGYCSYEFRVLCPDGVVTLDTRVAMGKLTLENLQKMRGDALYGAQLLGSAGPDVITYEATAAGFVLGVEGDQALIREIEEKTGIRATTGASSVAASLEALGIKKVSIYAATPEEVTQFTVRYLADKGFDVRDQKSVSFSSCFRRFSDVPLGGVRRGREVLSTLPRRGRDLHRRRLLPDAGDARDAREGYRPARRDDGAGQYVELPEDRGHQGPDHGLWKAVGRRPLVYSPVS